MPGWMMIVAPAPSPPADSQVRTLGTDCPYRVGRHITSSDIPRRSTRTRNRPQLIDPLQNRREQRPRHRHLGQLERDDLRMAHDFRVDLDQLLPNRRLL